MGLYSFTCLFNRYVPLNLYTGYNVHLNPAQTSLPSSIAVKSYGWTKFMYFNIHIFVCYQLAVFEHIILKKQLQTWFVQSSWELLWFAQSSMQYSDPWDTFYMRAETSIWLVSRIVIMSDIAMPHPLPLPSLPVCSQTAWVSNSWFIDGLMWSRTLWGGPEPCTNTLTGMHIWAVTHILMHIHYLTDFMFLMIFKMLWCNGLYLITSCEWRSLKMCRTGSVTFRETQPTT